MLAAIKKYKLTITKSIKNYVDLKTTIVKCVTKKY